MGKNNNETEITIYAMITDPEGLKQATQAESILQAESQLGKDGKCRTRIRSTKIAEDDPEYTQTVKIPLDRHVGVSSVDEHTTPVTEGYFNGCLAAMDTVHEKTRYHFGTMAISLIIGDEEHSRSIEIPSVKYEVDVYPNEDGSINEWCKIDVEVDDILTYMEQNHPDIQSVKFTVGISGLPFKPKGGIIAEQANDVQKAFIEEFWNKVHSVYRNKQKDAS